MKTILYYATAGMLGLFLGLGIMYSIPSWNCANGEVVNSNDECQDIKTLSEVAGWRNSSQYNDDCHYTANELLSRAIDYGVLLQESYSGGYYYSAYEEGIIDTSAQKFNQDVINYEAYCFAEGVEAL